MERFNYTSKGYRFDKLLLWAVVFLWLAIMGGIWSKEGLTFKPYFNCLSLDGCENPFSDSTKYRCTLGFGFIPCTIEYQDWMKEPILPYGKYGVKPKSYTWFGISFVVSLLIALILNHFLYNKGRQFHLTIFDKFNKMEED